MAGGMPRFIYAFPEPLPMPRARGIQAVQVVAALARCGIDVGFAFVPGAEDPFEHYGVMPPLGVRRLPVSRSLPWPLSAIHSNRLFAARLSRILRQGPEEPVVLARHLKLASLLLERAPELPLIYEAHEVFADTAPAKKAAMRREEESRVMRAAAAIVANSQATAARLTQLYGAPRTMEVIPNGVDRPESLPEKDWARAGRHVVYAGSFFPWKGVADLVAAAASLPGVRIELMGGEPDRVRELRARAPRDGAELAFAGHIAHGQVLARLATACIAVLPNRAEPDSAFTSPIKLFEYMAAGCAIVASDLPAIREVLAVDEAVWARPADPSGLAAGISALAADPERARRLAERVREKSRQFTWDARARRLKAVIEQVAQARP